MKLRRTTQFFVQEPRSLSPHFFPCDMCHITPPELGLWLYRVPLEGKVSIPPSTNVSICYGKKCQLIHARHKAAMHQLTSCVYTLFTPTCQCDNFDYVRNVNPICIDLCQKGSKSHVVYSSPLSVSPQAQSPTDDDGEKIQSVFTQVVG